MGSGGYWTWLLQRYAGFKVNNFWEVFIISLINIWRFHFHQNHAFAKKIFLVKNFQNLILQCLCKFLLFIQKNAFSQNFDMIS